MSGNASSDGLFVTGTDTGVGKTFLAARIARLLHDRRLDVGVMKPAETGCIVRQGELVPADARQLLAASGASDPLHLVNPYRFREPLAPMVAAEREGRRIVPNRILSAYRRLLARHDFLLVEGAGGLLVPLSRTFSYLDLVQAMAIPVLIVARPDLGTINHTVLTVMALHSRDIPVAGIVLNHQTRKRPGLAVRTNPSAIRRLTGLKVFEVAYGGEGLSGLLSVVGH